MTPERACQQRGLPLDSDCQLFLRRKEVHAFNPLGSLLSEDMSRTEILGVLSSTLYWESDTLKARRCIAPGQYLRKLLHTHFASSHRRRPKSAVHQCNPVSPAAACSVL